LLRLGGCMKVDVRSVGYRLLVIGFQSFTDSDAAYFSLAAKSGCIFVWIYGYK